MYQKKVKKNNENKLLYHLYKDPVEFTTVDIGETLQMSFPTVKSIINNLLKKGIIKESLKIDIKLGRRAKHYQLNRDFIYGIGVRLSSTSMEIVLINELGEIKKEFFIKDSFNSENIFESFEKYMGKFLLNLEDEVKKNISGIGVGIPGVVIKEMETIEVDKNLVFKFKDIERLEKIFDLKILIENNANVSAFGEKFLTKRKGIDNFISLNIGERVSMSLFKENMDTGSFSVFAPRIEHMTVNINGEKCFCGENGCLGMYIKKDKFKIDEIESFEKYLDYLSAGIKNIIFLYNPEKIIISGFLCEFEKEIKEKLLKKIYKNNIFFKGRETILFSNLKDETIILGSGILPIVDKLF